ncbi:hypothetical protein BOW53_00785 [Solemya pervernicosa gill symbiont]|uniref:DUF2802 domain-containing protein n=2 Tax=Gammaproteobacteria incertae sedis TaxID=118884 RepID=A0A1T2LB15_9GAMM|nr:DUF2802 domain-containing protein [Candidatus Reidiella endopervernicosa]OOZ42146.1 hypothetical protein BOW53_00785 [Solemya pervernicosa gill symbiont]QKQ27290.1 DUF2802 domain-containing protein [Candidatus Reidiella endopervernicosa]
MTIALFIVSLAALATAAVAIYQLTRVRRELDAFRQTRVDLNATRDDVSALCSGAVGVGNRLNKLEQRLRSQNERQDQLDLRTSGERPYLQAGKLVHSGASIDELINTCGLTRGEAELIFMMNSAESAGNA